MGSTLSPGLSDVTKEEILRALERVCQGSPPSPVLNVTPVQPPLVDPSLPGDLLEYPSLMQIADRSFNTQGRSPSTVFFPDGTQQSVKSWRELTASVVEWCGNRYGLPKLPFLNGHISHATTYFMSTQPINPDGSSFSIPRKFEIAGQQVYVLLHNSAVGFCKSLSRFMEAVNADPAGVRVQLSE